MPNRSVINRWIGAVSAVVVAGLPARPIYSQASASLFASAATTTARVYNGGGAGHAPPKVRVSVDWDTALGHRLSPALYGLNLYRAPDKKSVVDGTYAANLAYMGPRLVRIHNGGIMQASGSHWEGLLNEKRHTWDIAKVLGMVAAIRRALPEADIVFNVPGWPAWMDRDGDGFLDADEQDNYAGLLADLVRIVNREGKLGVRYWEITNEMDGRYWTDFYQNGGYGPLKDEARPDRMPELIGIYNRCATAMKQVDPSIRTGGPAAARSDLQAMHEAFITGTLPHLDFFSIHAYASGSAADPDSKVFDTADTIARYAERTTALMHRHSPAREIPVILGEYNVSWDWQTRDERMVNNKGAVFDALILVQAARSGIFSAQSWNDKDNIYGKTDDSDRRRPGAELLHLFNSFLTGIPAQARSSDDSSVVAFAVSEPRKNRRSLLLINRTDTAQPIALEFPGGIPVPRRVAVYRIDAAGSTEATWPMAIGIERTRILPPDSVTLLVF